MRLAVMWGGIVTAFKHLLEHIGRRFFIDCGFFQGYKNFREMNWGRVRPDVSRLDSVVLRCVRFSCATCLFQLSFY